MIIDMESFSATYAFTSFEPIVSHDTLVITQPTPVLSDETSYLKNMDSLLILCVNIVRLVLCVNNAQYPCCYRFALLYLAPRKSTCIKQKRIHKIYCYTVASLKSTLKSMPKLVNDS